MPYEPPPSLAALSLGEITALAEGGRLPPVERWAPAHTGDSEMRIATDGRWFHQGGEITRPAMVRAFSRLLWRDGVGQHWLVTPQEKLAIAVDDAAFIAVDVTAREDALAFRLNTDETVIAGPDHPIRARGSANHPAIYLGLRHGLEARLNRSTWAQLAEIALAGEGDAVSSQGARFPLVPA
ncbi:MAG TPA: DUF1285 domain-containing protein [Novosphingobium sp.]|nr:DUF1285 domain-containing protein [Novosphingobium sp.]